MKTVVCIKPVKGEINPFDECALEEALQIENAEITVLSMGAPSAGNMLKALTRLGIHRAVLLTDNAFAGSDTLATAYVLSCAVKKLDPDLIICGRQSTDGGTAQTGPCLAQMLELSAVTNIIEIQSITDKIKCKTRMGEEEATLPALICVEKINTLRFPGARAKTKEIETWNASDINADLSKCGLKGSPTRVLQTYECHTGQRKCKYIKPGDLMRVIEQEKSKMRAEIKLTQSDIKLDEIWAVGGALKQTALSVAKSVKIIGKQPPQIMAQLAKANKPRAILWTADLWGAKHAPMVAAILQTGLCADCTHLKTDGEKLYMYRPAYGGSLMAKIECKTYPQMATVRMVSKTQDDIIIAGGKGARDDFALIKAFANKIGGSVGASRGLVDMRIAPYAMQIGLSGKTVSPKIYIACGISGSVQHTCAVENSGTIIAINSDKNARIFDYADYGIIGEIKEIFTAIS
jgi:electron transfer flavoprotein alpha subunit